MPDCSSSVSVSTFYAPCAEDGLIRWLFSVLELLTQLHALSRLDHNGCSTIAVIGRTRSSQIEPILESLDPVMPDLAAQFTNAARRPMPGGYSSASSLPPGGIRLELLPSGPSPI